MINPTNADIIHKFDEYEEFQDDTRKVHAEQLIFKAETEGHLAEITKKMDLFATKEDIATIVEQVIAKILKDSGKRGYAGLLVVAGIVGALVVIGGGLKTALAWIGFTYMK